VIVIGRIVSTELGGAVDMGACRGFVCVAIVAVKGASGELDGGASRLRAGAPNARRVREIQEVFIVDGMYD